MAEQKPPKPISIAEAASMVDRALEGTDPSEWEGLSDEDKTKKLYERIFAPPEEP